MCIAYLAVFIIFHDQIPDDYFEHVEAWHTDC